MWSACIPDFILIILTAYMSRGCGLAMFLNNVTISLPLLLHVGCDVNLLQD